MTSRPPILQTHGLRWDTVLVCVCGQGRKKEGVCMCVCVGGVGGWGALLQGPLGNYREAGELHHLSASLELDQLYDFIYLSHLTLKHFI